MWKKNKGELFFQFWAAAVRGLVSAIPIACLSLLLIPGAGLLTAEIIFDIVSIPIAISQAGVFISPPARKTNNEKKFPILLNTAQ